uniref:Solute carrier family 13 member 5 n=1 Tax=Romanomermis culicivorax TaxID=13658 RepID=A0A915IY71_ROMCU
TSQEKTATDATPEHHSNDSQPTPPSTPKEPEVKKSSDRKSATTAAKTSVKVNLANDQTTTTCNPIKLTPTALNREELIICKMMIISTCYASSIGGIGTITGTPPNIIVFGFVEKTYGKETGLTYLSWILFALPIVVLNTIFCWMVLWIYFLGFMSYSKNSGQSSVTDVIRHHYDKLGKMKYQEWTVAGLFFGLVLLWIFHSPQFMPGWADFFPAKYVSGATPAIFAGFLLFALPKEMPDCRGSKEALMSWKWMQSKLPWDMILLMGGGFAMADGVEKSGLSVQIGNYLNYLVDMKAFLICSVVVITASLTTEFTNNSAIVTIFTPIVNALAQQAKLNPLYLILSCGLSVSYAFMLPVGTPANAIVFGLGLITVLDMIKVGFFMNIVTAVITIIAMNTWSWLIFGFGNFPDWASKNATDVVVSDKLVHTTLVSNSSF